MTEEPCSMLHLLTLAAVCAVSALAGCAVGIGCAELWLRRVGR